MQIIWLFVMRQARGRKKKLGEAEIMPTNVKSWSQQVVDTAV